MPTRVINYLQMTLCLG